MSDVYITRVSIDLHARHVASEGDFAGAMVVGSATPADGFFLHSVLPSPAPTTSGVLCVWVRSKAPEPYVAPAISWPRMVTTELSREIARVHDEVLPHYIDKGPTGEFAVRAVREALREADEAIEAKNVQRMFNALKRLKDCTIDTTVKP